MKTLIILLSITSTIYSQTVGISIAPPRLGAGTFYNSNEFRYTKTAIFAGFDAGKYQLEDRDYTIIKPSIGITYIVNKEYDLSSKIIGTICYNYMVPNKEIVSEISVELGIMLIYNKLSFIIMYDIANHDIKIGIGRYFK